MSLTIATQIFLSTIAFSEGTNERYDLTFNFHRIRMFDRHPAIVIKGQSYYSSAAGRYQFIQSTYVDMQRNCRLYKIPDFKPDSQDKAAVCLLERYKVKHNEIHLAKKNLQTELNKVNMEWASLPNSQLEQPTNTIEKLWKFYKKESDKLNGKNNWRD